EGVQIKTGIHAGVDITADQLRTEFDAVLLTCGAMQPRDLPVEGRDLKGIHLAMEFLSQQNHRLAGDHIPPEKEITARGKRVVVLGGGDTGADCVGTSHRQGVKELYQFEIMPKPPLARNETMPWPYWPFILRTSTSHEEGGKRDWSICTKKFSGTDGKVEKLHAVRVEFGEPGPDGRRQLVEI